MADFSTLRETHVALEEISFPAAPRARGNGSLPDLRNLGNVAGYLAECLVAERLRRAGMALDQGVPARVNGYTLSSETPGMRVVVRNGTSGRDIHEYDFLARDPAGEPFVVEAKAGNITSVERALLRGTDIAEHIYGRRVPTVIFSPASATPSSFIGKLRRMEGVVYIDLGCERGDFERAARAYVRQMRTLR